VTAPSTQKFSSTFLKLSDAKDDMSNKLAGSINAIEHHAMFGDEVVTSRRPFAEAEYIWDHPLSDPISSNHRHSQLI
jgi:hypothetical protein